ncbi:MAG: metallophosphoesterase [Actinomycetota bacterium]|nr:metallophosphoesterase [Actinomycetota bacterium]
MRVDPGALSAFAVEDRSVQVSWGWLPAPGLTVEVGGSEVALPAASPAYVRHQGRLSRQVGRGPVGPGAVTVDGLEASTAYDVTVHGPGRPRRRIARVTTLAPPPGRLTARFATINDTHLGERGFGGLGTMTDVVPLPPDLDPYPERCARAAIAEAAEWGSELILAKGDLTRDSEPVEFHEVGRMLADAPVPVGVILGNHDVRHRIDGTAILGRYGIAVAGTATAIDLPGLRIILAHTPVASERRGRLGKKQLGRIAALAAGAPSGRGCPPDGSSAPDGNRPGPVVVAVHHAPQQMPVATHYPPGLYAAESRRFVAALNEANPTSMIIAGHTHRNRCYWVDGVMVSEVGSTKDYPGVWAGYAVYEGGIRQVVRRIASPSAMAWTEATRQALFGLWGLWSSSSMDQRCWVRAW